MSVQASFVDARLRARARCPSRAARACASCAAAARAARRTTARARRRSRRRRGRRAAAASAHSSSRYTSCTTCSLNGNAVPRSCASVVFATAQPLCSAADEMVVGHEHVVEEHLVELRVAGDLHERTHLDAGRLHVDDEVRDALVLRRVGIGAGEADAPPRELRVAGPHLLAREQPAVVDARRRGRQRREVGAGVGLAEQLAPDLVGA